MHSRSRTPIRPGFALLAMAILLLPACQPVPPRATPPAVSPVPATVAPLHGRVLLPGGAEPPAGARLEVLLVLDAESDEPRVLAVADVPAAGGAPFAFTLSGEAVCSTGEKVCSLRAVIRNARGHLLFHSARRVPLDPDHRTGVVEIPMVGNTGP